MDAELLDLCQETVQLAKLQETDSRTGARVFGAAVGVRGHVEQFARVVTDSQGRSVASNTRVFLAPKDELGGAVAPTVNDQLTLPSGYTPASPPIISVQRENDPETGEVAFWVVSL